MPEPHRSDQCRAQVFERMLEFLYTFVYFTDACSLDSHNNKTFFIENSKFNKIPRGFIAARR